MRSSLLLLLLPPPSPPLLLPLLPLPPLPSLLLLLPPLPLPLPLCSAHRVASTCMRASSCLTTSCRVRSTHLLRGLQMDTRARLACRSSADMWPSPSETQQQQQQQQQA
jgi:hypothetical protein